VSQRAFLEIQDALRMLLVERTESFDTLTIHHAHIAPGGTTDSASPLIRALHRLMNYCTLYPTTTRKILSEHSSPEGDTLVDAAQLANVLAALPVFLSKQEVPKDDEHDIYLSISIYIDR
jgi:hypothetical protein